MICNNSNSEDNSNNNVNINTKNLARCEITSHIFAKTNLE